MIASIIQKLFIKNFYQRKILNWLLSDWFLFSLRIVASVLIFQASSEKIRPEKWFLGLGHAARPFPCRGTLAEMGLPLGRWLERGCSRVVHQSHSWKTSRQFVKWHVSHGGHSSFASPFWLSPSRSRRFLSFSFPVGQHNASRGISRVYKINPLIVAQ